LRGAVALLFVGAEKLPGISSGPHDSYAYPGKKTGPLGIHSTTQY